jgi:hypothetical protein
LVTGHRSQRGGNGSGDGNGDDSAETPHRRLNEAALANLDAWVPALQLYKVRRTPTGFEAVAIWRPSSTGRKDQARSRNLKIASKGIRDFGADAGYTPLDLVMAALGCDLEAAFAFLSERLGWGQVDISLPLPGREEDATTAESEPPDETATDNKPEVVDELERYTYVPGAVGDIVDWVTSTARRPNRILALGAAIVVIGTLIGRRVAGPTNSATHLYVVTVAPATAGKRASPPLHPAADGGGTRRHARLSRRHHQPVRLQPRHAGQSAERCGGGRDRWFSYALSVQHRRIGSAV